METRIACSFDPETTILFWYIFFFFSLMKKNNVSLLLNYFTSPLCRSISNFMYQIL